MVAPAPLTASLIDGLLWLIGPFLLLSLVMTFMIARFKNKRNRGHDLRMTTAPNDKDSLHENPNHSASERRQSARRWGNPIMVQVADELAQTKLAEGIVLNRSADGLCLSLDQSIKVGVMLTVRASTAPPASPWVPVAVRHCQPFYNRWKVGVQFAQAPAHEVLVLFG